MPIKYEKIDSFRKGDGWTVETIKIIVGDYDPPKEKIVSLDNYDNNPATLEKNLAIQTDEFVSEIKSDQKVVDISASLDKVAISANAKHKNIKAVTN